MKRLIYPYILFLLLLTTGACEKEDPGLLTGDILGQVTVFDQDQYVLEDLTNVMVELESENLRTETATNASGIFAFLGVDYGNYIISPRKEGYVPSSGPKESVHHLGGYNPTRVSYRLYEIPRFRLEIDSVRLERGTSLLWLKFEDWNGEPKYWYYCRCFFSGSPEVSKDAFFTQSQGWLYGLWIENDHYEAFVENYWLNSIESDSIYIRVYPEAWGQQLYTYSVESLGQASRVLAVKNPFLEQ